MSLSKKGYFQGGGGVNEPTPGEKKYKSDPALVVQPRFKEPFYYNYDLYTIPGMEDIGPGTGYHGLQNYKSVQEFLADRRERLKPRYVADDSWQVDSGERVKKNPGIKARAAIFERIVKTANAECKDSDIEYTDRRDAYICKKCFHMGENCGGPKPTAKELHSGKNHNTDRIDYRNNAKTAGPNYDLGKGLYQEMSDGKVDSVEEFREEGNHGPGALMNVKKKDVNHIDFPIDDDVNRQDQMIYPEEDQYQIRREKGDKYQFPSDGSPMDPGELNISMTTPQIAGEHSYLPEPDFEGKSDNGSQLDFGRDYTEETLPGRGSDIASDDDKQMNLDELESKYLESTETGIFGLPDGVDPEGHDADQTEQIEQPFTGTSDIGTNMYDDKWNI